MGPTNYDSVTRYLVLVLACIFQGISLDWQVRDVMDLLQSLNVSQPTHGYRFTSLNKTPVLILQDSTRYLKVPDHVLTKTLKYFKENNEITFLATVRQEVGDSGSIIAFSSDIIRFLELESSGRRSEIRFHYTHDQQIHVETFPYRLADNMWHNVALSVSGTHVKLLVNCSKIYERVIKSIDKEYTAGKLSLFVGQRNGQHALFRGALKDVKIVTQAHGYLLQCPYQNTDCPTCAQYQDLEARVEQMYTLYENLSVKLLQAEERLTDLEKCECHKKCYDNSTIYKEGDTWNLDKCTQCECMNGSIICEKVACPPARCKHPVYKGEDCCPVCLNDCYYLGQYYDHGETMTPRTCVLCICNDGNMVCEKEDNCPRLNCSKEDQLTIQGECCPVCKGIDYCSQGHECHENATCVNLDTRYTCQCQTGYQGDGWSCEDIDECLVEGGRQGHHCYGKTVCVNTPGAYKCQCKIGYHQSDGDTETCEDVDECSLGIANCEEHSVCVNLPGWYHCSCVQGYHRIWPNSHSKCQDINECEGEGNSCHSSMTCINTEGSYRCQCQHNNQSCSTNCIYEGDEYQDSSSWMVDKCTQCTCNMGVSSCKQVKCDCASDIVNSECCPQCISHTPCEHQELPFVYENGQSWTFQCQTCECLNGEVDCWPLECPKVACQSVEELPGECCPRCLEDNPCVSEQSLGGLDFSDKTCTYKERAYNHFDTWPLDNDPCTLCECKAGHICCSFNQTCV